MQKKLCIGNAMRKIKPSPQDQPDLRAKFNRIIMRIQLVTLIIFISCVHVAARVHSQGITLKLENQTLDQAFKTIEQKSNYSFWFVRADLKGSHNVSGTFSKASIKDILDHIMKDQPLTYKIVNNIISLKPRNNLEEVYQQAPAQQEPVTGVVSDENAKPMAGVTVTVKSSNTKTVTDGQGKFTIVAAHNAVLVFQFVGYKTKEWAVNGARGTSLTMDPEVLEMNELVVKGYYNTTKTLNTGNVSSVKGTDIAKQPVGDPLMALEGRVPGLYISQTSGVPGAALNVRLRGQNSIANGNSPFYIIDGIPFPSTSLSQNFGAANNISPFSSINTSDIESIEVLKDADATAIYGSRGANGVILITTKRGRSGRTRVDLNINSGIGKTASRLELMNTEQYLQMRNEAFKNDNASLGVTDYDLNGTWSKSRYTDWQQVLVGGTAKSTDAQLSITGGNELTQFFIGGGYRRETTVYPGENSVRKTSGKLSVTHSSENRKFRAQASLSYVNDNNQLPSTDLNSNIFLAPNAPVVYKDNGDLNWENSTWVNPLAVLKQKMTSITDNFIGSVEMSYKILDNLKLNTSLSYNNVRVQDTKLMPFSSLDPATANPAGSRSNASGINNLKSWIVEPQINYSKGFGPHQLDVLVGTTFQENKQVSNNINASGFSSDGQIESFASATSIINRNNLVQYRYTAAYARIGYDFKGKYVLNLTGRRDGSSRFGPENRFGNFGAIGTAWIFSKEPFVREHLPFVSFGKLRASIGSTGNDQLTDYQYLDTYTPNSLTYLGVAGLNPTQLTNQYFGWETIKKTEVALELGFLKDRITFNTSFYRNRTGNQLVGYPLPAVAGFATIQANLPAVIENKGWEFELNSENIKQKNFRWSSSLNISFPKNKLVSYPNLPGSSYATTYVLGQPLFVKFLYQYKGIDPQTGIYTFEDILKDGQITFAGDRAPTFIGQKFFGGLNNSFSYKNFSLDIFAQFVKQNGYSFFNYLSAGLMGYNQPIAQLDRWQSAQNPGTYQKYSQAFGPVYTAYTNFDGSTGRIVDASFLRIKNVVLSYNISKHIIQRLKISNLRFYLQGQNLFTISGFKGLDPETQATGFVLRLPPIRVLTIGLQLTL